MRFDWEDVYNASYLRIMKPDRYRLSVGMVIRHNGWYGVYRETPEGPYVREFLCTMPTLDEAKAVLQTVAAANF
jgi:hypothetical protein